MPPFVTTTRAWRWRCALLVVGLLFGSGAVARDEAVTKEYQVKAAFLYNFAKYVEWPAGSFAAADTRIVIGAYCPDAFGAVLNRIVARRTIGGRAIAVRVLKAAAEAKDVHLVYVCARNDELWAPLYHAVKGSPVLTVADSEKVAAGRAMVVFVLEGDKIRFSINVYQVGPAGLKISDQLQKLAITVRRTP